MLDMLIYELNEEMSSVRWMALTTQRECCAEDDAEGTAMALKVVAMTLNQTLE